MVQLLGIAWAAWKLSAKRFGPVGGAVVAGLAVVGYMVLRDRLERDHPQLHETIENTV